MSAQLEARPRGPVALLRTALLPGVLVATYLVVFFLVSIGVIGDYQQTILATICINIVLATSLNLVTGFTGQFSLGHAGFMAIGAYATGLMTMRYPSIWGLVGGLLVGAALASVVGFLIGIPTLRLRGDYLAIATLGMAEIIRVLLLNFDFSNGAAGLNGIPRLINWHILFIFAACSIVLIANFLRSVHGRNTIAVREDEIAASSIGVNALWAKTLAFVIGAFFGGIAGGLYASYFYFIKPDMFGFLKSIDILIIVVLGGLGSLSGSVISAILLALISMKLQEYAELRMVFYGLILVLIMLFRPQGLFGDGELKPAMFGYLLPWRYRYVGRSKGTTRRWPAKLDRVAPWHYQYTGKPSGITKEPPAAFDRLTSPRKRGGPKP
ncbi:MAG: branched-chain amino acid ABC transporter permease [Micrococcales bacterium]|nr:branched-chain amino acid ABC transporter permease [Micrococcales bacterium]